MIFGSGTRLNIEPTIPYKADYYKLEGDGTTACLATGFSRQDATVNHTYNDQFEKTEPVRIADDKVYNQVALLPSGDNGDKCEKDGSKEASCEDTLNPDPTVNFVAMTILCLRLIFIKTVVFNVLMTFRLWISQ
ncbi:M1-specific T cell receptor alpha chain-like [Pagrus major]|uniref:M1-specific T cell receptor alpha chain-like n=1 Tax=Pagrus major TaxID=143350 RepID=UPI003CC853AB